MGMVRAGSGRMAAVSLSRVIRLDAATVLLQWAAGGLLFLWFTTRRREVGVGYGWLLRGTNLLLAAGAALCGFRFGVVAVREASSIAVVLASSVALVVSVVRRRAGVSGQSAEHDRRSECVAAMTGIERGPSPPLLTRVASIRFSPFLSGIRFTGIVSSLTRRSSSTGLSLR